MFKAMADFLRKITMENLIYWNEVSIGIENGDYVTFFPCAPAEAIAALSREGKKVDSPREAFSPMQRHGSATVASTF
jgi:hypothetical protein